MDLETGLDLNRGPLVRSHFRDELHCVCAHPLRQVGGPSQHLPRLHTHPLIILLPSCLAHPHTFIHALSRTSLAHLTLVTLPP